MTPEEFKRVEDVMEAPWEAFRTIQSMNAENERLKKENLWLRDNETHEKEVWKDTAECYHKTLEYIKAQCKYDGSAFAQAICQEAERVLGEGK